MVGYGAHYGYGSGYGYGVTGSRGLLAKVGSWTTPVPTGAQSVSGVGFRSKLLGTFFPGLASESGLSACMSLGVANETKQCTISASSLNGVTTSVAHRRHTTNRIISHLFGGSVNKDASLSSIDPIGFSLNWNTAGDARDAGYFAIGGTDVEVSITDHQCNATNLDESFAHGLAGGPPTALLFYSIAEPNAPPLTTAILSLSIGMWANGVQGCSASYSNNGVTTTSCRRLMLNNAVVVSLETSNRRSMAVSSVDATNVNVTYPVTASSGQVRFIMVSIRGCAAKVGTYNLNAATGEYTISTPGMKPKLFLATAVPSGVSAVGIVSAGVFNCMIASDGTTTFSHGMTDLTGVTTSNARRYRSTSSYRERNDGSVVQIDASISFVDKSVIINAATNASSIYGQGTYLALGDAA